MPNRFAIALGVSSLLAAAPGCGSQPEPVAKTNAIATATKPAASTAEPALASKPAQNAAPSEPLLVATARRDECAQCTPPRYCTAGLCIEAGAVVASGRRGANYGELAPELFRYQDMDQNDAVAPGGLAATDGDGRLFVLDQLDDQIHSYRAEEFEDAIATPTDAAIDYFTLLPDGRLVLLDGDGGRNVLLVIDRQGKVLEEQPLAGKGFAPGEPAHGLCTRPDGVWARRASDMVRLMDLQGEPDPDRPVVAGLLSGDGRSVLDARANGMTLEVSAKARDGKGGERTGSATFDKALALAQTESDGAGALYVLVDLLQPSAQKGESLPSNTPWLVVFGPDMKERRRIQLPEKKIPHLVQRSLFVSTAGVIYYLDAQRTEVSVHRY